MANPRKKRSLQLRSKKGVCRAATAVLLCLGIATSAEANAGLPMLAVVWPISWALLLPIIAVEALVASRSTALSLKKCVLGSAIANAVSTLVAIPVTWGLLLLVEMVLTSGGRAFGLSSVGGKLLAVTIQAPWLIPYESDLDWMVPSAALVLLIPFFFASVFIESMAFKMSTSADAMTARGWSWRANAITYGCIFVLTAALTIHAFVTHEGSPKKAALLGGPNEVSNWVTGGP